MVLTFTFFILGLLILVVGAEGLVRCSSLVALRLGVTPLVIGLTVVAFGTSSPELAVSVEAALSGNSSIAMGNVIGSNIANIGLILGLTAMIRPMRVSPVLLRAQIPQMIGISLVLWLLALDGTLGVWDGLLLVAGLVAFVVHSYLGVAGTAAVTGLTEIAPVAPAAQYKAWFLIVLFAGALAVGGMLFVNSAVEMARLFNLSEAVIGLTIVAVGTSMPELATSVVAALHKESDIAIGNIVGSNILNILAILGLTALISPLAGAGFSNVDYAAMIGFAVILLPMAWSGRMLSRPEGTVLLLGYFSYMAWIWP